MKNENLTELVFILDRSGSMAGLESDTIGGFNGMIEKQKKEDGECFVSTILFDHVSEVLHDRLPLSKVPMLTDRDYTVRGCTALRDALGHAIHHISNIHKYARKEDVPSQTLFVMITDGYENASRDYSAREIRNMISEKKELGWEFIFIGANIDAVTAAGEYGIAADRAVNYHSDEMGTKVVYQNLSSTISGYRTEKKIAREWQAEIDEDFHSRNGKSGKTGPVRHTEEE